MMCEAVEIRVIGRVQGVGFRWFTCQTADEYGIQGWVRNEPDGSVLLQARGTPQNMQLFKSRIQEGPRFGRVDQMIEAPLDEQAAAAFSGFQTAY